MDDLLPTSYYHVVFTLPHQILEIAILNLALIYDILFKTSAETITDFAKNPKWIGGQVGFYGILHTWGGQLWQHFHIHYIVPSGGLNKNGEWVESKYKAKFLFPVKAMSIPFRQKFIEALTLELKKGNLKLPAHLMKYKNPEEFQKWIHNTYPPRWVIFAKSPFAGPEKVVKYIGMYSHRVAISNYSLIKLENEMVHFKYKFNDKRKKITLWTETKLAPLEFIRRFLLHVVPKNFHRVRHFGLFANGKCQQNIEKMRLLLTDRIKDKPQQKEEKLKIGRPCPICNIGKLVHIFIALPHKTIWFSQLDQLNLPALYDCA